MLGDKLGDLLGDSDGEALGDSDTDGLTEDEALITDVSAKASHKEVTSLPAFKYQPSLAASFLIKTEPFLNPESPSGTVMPEAITILSESSRNITSL